MDDASLFGEDALDRAPPRVAEDDTVSADAEPAMSVERWLEGFDVALLGREATQGTSNSLLGPGRKATGELGDLRCDEDLHRPLSTADSGRKRVRPARWSAIAFCAAGLERISIVSTMASR